MTVYSTPHKTPCNEVITQYEVAPTLITNRVILLAGSFYSFCFVQIMSQAKPLLPPGKPRMKDKQM
jgi:hypothetical protein